MAKKPKWSKRVPRKQGWYWARTDQGSDPRPTQVHKGDVYWCGEWYTCVGLRWPALEIWPIPIPEPPKEQQP